MNDCNLFVYELTSHPTPHTKLYQQNHTKSFNFSSLNLQVSVTAISIHNANLLSSHFWKIATVSHFRLVSLCSLFISFSFSEHVSFLIALAFSLFLSMSFSSLTFLSSSVSSALFEAFCNLFLILASAFCSSDLFSLHFL